MGCCRTTKCCNMGRMGISRTCQRCTSPPEEHQLQVTLYLPTRRTRLQGRSQATLQQCNQSKSSLSDCMGPVQSPLMGINGALSASGGYHIVIRGWDTDCSGEDVYKMQAKYTINDHRIDTSGVATFDVSYNSSSGVFQGERVAPRVEILQYNYCARHSAYGPDGTGATGATGATGPLLHGSHWTHRNDRCNRSNRGDWTLLHGSHWTHRTHGTHW